MNCPDAGHGRHRNFLSSFCHFLRGTPPNSITKTKARHAVKTCPGFTRDWISGLAEAGFLRRWDSMDACVPIHGLDQRGEASVPSNKGDHGFPAAVIFAERTRQRNCPPAGAFSLQPADSPTQRKSTSGRQPIIGDSAGRSLSSGSSLGSRPAIVSGRRQTSQKPTSWELGSF